MISDTGSTNTELILQWLKQFPKFVKPSEDILLFWLWRVVICTLPTENHCVQTAVMLGVGRDFSLSTYKLYNATS